MMPESTKLTLTLVIRLQTASSSSLGSISHVLLGLKKRGFGLGKWNGFGGKVEANESVVDAAIRELEEESGLRVLSKDIRKCGELLFEFEGSHRVMDVDVFFVDIQNTAGEPKETEEMCPRWFKVEEIPYDLMWADDREWMPAFLRGNAFYGKFRFAADESTILQRSLSFKSLPL